MTSAVATTFGALLRRHRRAAGLTQPELAERAGLSVRGVNDLERGARRHPRRATVALLADALGLAADERVAFLAAARRPGALLSPATSPPSDPQGGVPAGLTSGETLGTVPPADLPGGTVTFLFTDIEGSTRLLQRLGGPRYAEALAAHQRLLREAFAAHRGREVDTQGDSFFAAFPTAGDALACAARAQRALAAHGWPPDGEVRVRVGLHTGAPQLVGEGYVGLDVHRAARVAAAGHGGQVLLSEATAALVRDDPPEPGAWLRDLGSVRLKDLQRPERLYQLVLDGLPADFPPLRALDARPHNLPIQPSPIFGREREIADLCRLLRRDDVRLVTLTGPGGIGKTRLSLQVAADVLDSFPDGVWNVRLSRLTDPGLVVPTIAQVLDLKESGSMPLAQVLRGYLSDKRLLLVLDNFEQIAEAAPDVADLLARCPGVKALVTSRATLHLRGEHEYALRPLGLPDPSHPPSPERLYKYAAVELFIERAQAAQADFALTDATAGAVAEICARLDGLPLAIELAAAQVKLLPPPALLKRLAPALPALIGGARDADERQRTMRKTLAWSYQLLAPEEQRLFRRMAVFVGGCTVEAAEAVCAAPEGAEPLGLDVLEGLSRLVDQSLVQRREEGGEAHFGMLHVIREFALECLEASERETEAEALRRAHAAYYVTLAEEPLAAAYVARDAAYAADPDKKGTERFEPEQDNLRAALAWLHTRAEAARQRGRTGRPEGKAAGRGGEAPAIQGLRLAGAMLWPWAMHGRLGEGRDWLEKFLALDASGQATSGTGAHRAAPAGSAAPASRGKTAGAAPSASQAYVRARALYAAGVLAYWQGDSAQAVPLLEQSRAILQALGERWTIGFVHNNLGMALQDRGDWQRARGCYEECLALGRALGARILMGMPLANLATLTLAAGDLERADAYSEEALAVCRQIDHTVEAVCLVVQALIAWRRGHLRGAETLASRALVLHRAVKDQRHFGDGLEACAIVQATLGQAERAARLLGAATASRKRVGMRRQMEVPTEDDIEAAVAPARAALGEEVWAAAFAAGQALTLDEAIAEALGEEVAVGVEAGMPSD